MRRFPGAPAMPVLAACALLTFPAAVPAQVDEIVVTAQRRAANLQEVPLAVSAFGADTVENLQIDRIGDIGANVPNLQTYIITAGAQALQVHARGASVQNPGFNVAESPVGLYIDEVYFGRLASANLELPDVERIEVLRGPQGTLYGRNTLAGAVLVVTRTPGDEFWADGSVGVGNYHTTRYAGSVGGPLRDGVLAGSVAALWDERDEGWQNNPVTGTEPGQYRNRAARAKLHWYGVPDLDVVLSGWAVRGENDGYNGVPYTPFARPDPDGPGGTDPAFLPAPPDSRPTGDFYDNFSPAGLNDGATRQVGVNLSVNWDVGAATLRSITAFADIDDRFAFDLAGGGVGVPFLPPGAPGLAVRSDSQLDQFTQELQVLGSALDDRLGWLAGLYYLDEDGTQLYAGGFLPPLADPPASLPAGAFAEIVDSRTRSYAAFGEATYALTPALSLTAGLRWTKDDKDYANACTGAFCRDGANPPGSAVVALDDDWDEITGKLVLDYRPDDNQLVYLSWAQGFQAGGFRSLCFGDLTAVCAGSVFDPQTVDSFAAGWKADLFDRRLRVNTVVFYAMYDDLQQTVISQAGGVTSFPMANIGEVDVYGVELEVAWSPIATLNVFAMLGLQESDFGQVNPLSPPGGLGGLSAPTKELPSNPEWQGKIGFDYTVPMERGLEFFYGFDLAYTDDYFAEPRNLVAVQDFTRLNGFLGIGAADERWQLVLSGKNITDEEDNVSGLYVYNFTNMRTPQPPAEYLLTLRVRHR